MVDTFNPGPGWELWDGTPNVRDDQKIIHVDGTHRYVWVKKTKNIFCLNVIIFGSSKILPKFYECVLKRGHKYEHKRDDGFWWFTNI